MNAVVLAPTYVDQWSDTGSLGAGHTWKLLRAKLGEFRHHVNERASAWEQPVRANLQEIIRECLVPNWDGYEARPVPPKTINLAYQLALQLEREVSLGIPAPELIPERDGEISISWDLAPEVVFSVSIGESGQINYAGILGQGVERHGGDKFNQNGKKSLRAISSIIEELFKHSRTQSARSA